MKRYNLRVNKRSVLYLVSDKATNAISLDLNYKNYISYSVPYLRNGTNVNDDIDNFFILPIPISLC